MAEPRSDPTQGGSASSGSQPTAASSGSSGQARPGETQVAIAIVAIVAAIFIWWAWKQGAFFGGVFFPGAIILYGLLILLLVAAPFNGRPNSPVRIALGAIVALAAWTLLSIVWTDWQDASVQYAQRDTLYATVFGLGLWCSNLAGRRMVIPLAAVAATGAVIGIVITITLASGTDVASYVHSDATLRFPIGYRNAEGAFLLVCLWPMVVLAAEGKLPWQLRALIIGAATMLLDLAMLAQSRGSLPAAAVALAVLLALSPRRLRVACYLGLAALPVLPALPTLLDVFQHGHAGPGLIPLLRDSARAIALSSLGSILLAAICIRGVELRLDLGRETVQRISRAAAVIAAAVVVLGGTIFIAQRGGPLTFVDQRVSEFKHGGDPNLQSQGTRFGVNVGSDRSDFWRVALHQGGDHPLLGAGAGSFRARYLQRRSADEQAIDPHSVEMLMFSELGIVGLLLWGTFLGGSAVAGLRSRRLGPSAAPLVAGSLAAGAYWFVHASYDWFWNYPALTAPVIFMLGASAAPALLNRAVARAGRARWVGIAVLALVLTAAVPLFFSQRYANRAYDEFPAEPNAALSDLGRAADLDPFDPQPLLAKGVIESRLGRNEQAVSTFRDAVDRQPQGYAAHFLLARALARMDLGAARAQADEALRLNPHDPQTRNLDRSLRSVASRKSQ